MGAYSETLGRAVANIIESQRRYVDFYREVDNEMVERYHQERVRGERDWLCNRAWVQLMSIEELNTENYFLVREALGMTSGLSGRIAQGAANVLKSPSATPEERHVAIMVAEIDWISDPEVRWVEMGLIADWIRTARARKAPLQPYERTQLDP